MLYITRMEKFIYSDSTYFYKDVLNLSKYKSEILDRCNTIIESMPHVTMGGYGYFMETDNQNFVGNIDIKNNLDEILNFGIQSCINAYQMEYNKSFDKINTDCWINVVRTNNPVQYGKDSNGLDYHIHTEINKARSMFYPHFTWVYYIQMPDNLNGDEGSLYMKDTSGDEYHILPNEGDIIIMPADLAHSPKVASKSTKDRMVLAGNVGFQTFKKQKSLI